MVKHDCKSNAYLARISAKTQHSTEDIPIYLKYVNLKSAIIIELCLFNEQLLFLGRFPLLKAHRCGCYFLS